MRQRRLDFDAGRGFGEGGLNDLEHEVDVQDKRLAAEPTPQMDLADPSQPLKRKDDLPFVVRALGTFFDEGSIDEAP